MWVLTGVLGVLRGGSDYPQCICSALCLWLHHRAVPGPGEISALEGTDRQVAPTSLMGPAVEVGLLTTPDLVAASECLIPRDTAPRPGFGRPQSLCDLVSQRAEEGATLAPTFWQTQSRAGCKNLIK